MRGGTRGTIKFGLLFFPNGCMDGCQSELSGKLLLPGVADAGRVRVKEEKTETPKKRKLCPVEDGDADDIWCEPVLSETVSTPRIEDEWRKVKCEVPSPKGFESEPLELPPFSLVVKRGLRDGDSAGVWNMVS